MFKVLLLVVFFSAACLAQLAGIKLFKCSHAVGLHPWVSGWDSRLPNYPIGCTDGRAPVEVLSVLPSEFAVEIRSLQKVVRRQGFILQFTIMSGLSQLVGFCITDTKPTSGSSLLVGNASPYIANTCGGALDSATDGSPKFNRLSDDGVGLAQGWLIRNPPPKDPTGLVITVNAGGTITGPTLKVPTGGCNWHVAWNFLIDIAQSGVGVTELQGPTAMQNRPVYNSVFADSAGLDHYRGIQPKEARTTYPFNAAECTDPANLCPNGPFATIPGPVAPCQWTSFDSLQPLNGKGPRWGTPYTVRGIAWRGTARQQAYGGLQTVLLSYANAPLHNPVGPDYDPTQGQMASDFPGRTGMTGTGNVMYANYWQGALSLLGFQLSCDASKANEAKWVVISFFGRTAIGSYTANGSPFQLNFPEPSSTAGLQQWNGNSSPTAVLGSVYIKATCRNVATATPTPPLYPFNYKFPIVPGTPNTASVTIEQCAYECTDVSFQARLREAVEGVCLEQGNHGCSLIITCVLSTKCFEALSTTELSPNTRRGLHQSTRTSWLMTIVVSAYAVSTIQLVASRVRAGSLFPWISPFSALNLVAYGKNGAATSIVFSTPSTAVPITAFPSIQAPWTGACYVYGTCREASCASSCNNGPIKKVTSYSNGDLFCSCNTCQGIARFSAYVFTSFTCGTSNDQATADVCCWNVMQDVVCWALDAPGVLDSDKQAIPSWTYRPPSIGTVIPTKPARTDGPRDCPSSSQSPKGLLGLLGLLGLIPLCFCCLLLLLCLLRRKKREGDIHFATFDPNAAPSVTACPSVPCPSVPVCPSVPAYPVF